MSRNGGPHFSHFGADHGKSRPPRPAFEYVDRMFRKQLEAVPAQVREYVRENLANVQFLTYGMEKQDAYLTACMADVQAAVEREGPDIVRADFGDVFSSIIGSVEAVKEEQRNHVDPEVQLQEELRDVQNEIRYELGGRMRGEQGHVGRTGRIKTKVVRKF